MTNCEPGTASKPSSSCCTWQVMAVGARAGSPAAAARHTGSSGCTPVHPATAPAAGHQPAAACAGRHAVRRRQHAPPLRLPYLPLHVGCPPPSANPQPLRAAHNVHNLLEVHRHARHLQVAVVRGVVDQLRHLVQAQLLGALAKHKEHRVDDVALAAAVGSNHGGEALHTQGEGVQASGPPLCDRSGSCRRPPPACRRALWKGPTLCAPA